METQLTGEILKLPLFNSAMSTSQKAVGIEKITGTKKEHGLTGKVVLWSQLRHIVWRYIII